MPYQTIRNQQELDKFIKTCRTAFGGSMHYARLATTEPLIVDDSPTTFGFYGQQGRNDTPRCRVEVHGGAVYLQDGDIEMHAYGDTRVHFEQGTLYAYEHVEVKAEGGGKLVASPHVVIRTNKYTYANITGGIVIPDIRWTHNWGIPAPEWLAHYRLTPDDDGVVTVYKGVGRYYESGQGYTYEPGSMPTAHDWRPTVACGAGLHFSPTPALTRRYAPEATRLLGCPVRVDEMVTLGDKIKAKRVVEPGCFLVDIHGRRTDEGGRLVDEHGNLIPV